MDLITRPRSHKLYRIEYEDNLAFQAIAKKLRIMDDEKVRQAIQASGQCIDFFLFVCLDLDVISRINLNSDLGIR